MTEFLTDVKQFLSLGIGIDDEKQCMLLVMRVLSIVPLNSKVSTLYCPDLEKPLGKGVNLHGIFICICIYAILTRYF